MFKIVCFLEGELSVKLNITPISMIQCSNSSIEFIRRLLKNTVILCTRKLDPTKL